MNDREFRVYEIRAEHFRDMLRNNYISDCRKLEAEFYYSAEPHPFAERFGLEGKKIVEGERFGELWSNAFFSFLL